ncbi:MAG: ATP-binding protein [Chloroflexi bacterium]|nr:ATP-binding protein [Chloroflexota bacterium]
MTTQSSLGAAPAPAGTAWSSELKQVLRQLQEEALLLTLPGLFAIGALISILAIQLADFDRSLWFAGTAFVLIGVVLFLRKLSYRAAISALVIGALLLNLMVILWLDLSWGIILLVLPAGLATVMLGVPAGAGVAAFCSALLLLVGEPAIPAPWEMRLMALIAIWGTVGTIWLTLRPLLTAVQWAWAGYEHNHALLEHMQDTQMQLKQTLEDLTSANIQLTRINQLADGLRQTAEDALQAKEQFVANVSHELRTPLNMIIGFSEMIVNTPEAYGGRIPPALLADLSIILRNSRHLSELIDDVLDLSQIEAGHMALTRERVDLREIFDAAAVAVRPLFESKGLSLTVETEGELPLVFCDRTRIREVALNLLSNAGRFTEQGGATIHAARNDDAVVVSVSDTGPGIASVDRDKVFRPFEQLDGSIRRRYGGSGLGLTISKSFVELHGGRMWLDSAQGTGTTFFFSLPIDPPIPMQNGAVRWLNPDWPNLARTHPPIATPPLVKPRLVLIDPNRSLQRLLVRYMDGTNVVPVEDLAAALREVSNAPAQALVVNSLQVGDWLVQLSKSSQLPYGTPAIICCVPGLTDIVDHLGVSGYLVKPIEKDDLLTTLGQLLAEDGHEQAQPATPQHNVPHTVLVVDDEPDALRLFWRMLDGSPGGYRVLTASDGRQAMDIMREHRPDAVLLDLVMPEADGFEFLTIKNADPSLREIPVVVISARDASRQPIVSNAIGITKPGGLSLHQLLTCIDTISKVLSPLHQSADPVPAADVHD